MHLFSVGAPYEEGVTSYPEGMNYQYEMAGHIVRLFLRSPTDHEVYAVRAGAARFGLFLVGSDVIFMLYRFYAADGQLCLTGECPYTIHLVHQDYRALPDLEYPAGVGAALSVHLVSADSGVVLGLRVLALTNRFSRLLSRAIYDQSLREFDRADYDARVDNAFAFYDHKRMWRAAVVTCRAGQVEDED